MQNETRRTADDEARPRRRAGNRHYRRRRLRTQGARGGETRPDEDDDCRLHQVRKLEIHVVTVSL